MSERKTLLETLTDIEKQITFGPPDPRRMRALTERVLSAAFPSKLDDSEAYQSGAECPVGECLGVSCSKSFRILEISSEDEREIITECQKIVGCYLDLNDIWGEEAQEL